jgi:Fic family protein
MDTAEFAPTAPGRLIDISGAKAFLPDLLPVDVPLRRDLVIAVDSARGALSEFIGQARLVQNIELIMAPLSRQEAVLSSKIEGTQTEVREVLLYEASLGGRAGSPGAGITDDSAKSADLREVMNYLRALRLGQDWVADGRPVNASLIRALHNELMRDVRGGDRSPGEFRKTQVYIGNRADGIQAARFIPPPPEHVSPLVDNLINFIQGPPSFGPLIDCGTMHYQFETIHPFEDGNGRIGRLLISLYLQEKKVIDRPILYLSSYLEKNRDEYVHLLKKVSMTGAWDEWALFFLRGVQERAIDSRDRVQRIMNLRDRYRSLATESYPSRITIPTIEFIMEHVFVTVSQIEKHVNSTYPTVKKLVDALARLEILRPQGRVSGAQVWVAEELLREIYER